MRWLVLMAKAPRAGYSKTRLIAPGGLDAAAAARLSEAFLRDTLATMSAVEDARRLIWYAPADAEDLFRALDPEAQLAPQPDAPFGARVAGAFEHAFASGATRVVVLGSDTPQLAPARLEQAFDALEDAEIALGPCPDGGYYLIGLRRPCPSLFEQVDWSTDRVLPQTRERARQAGLRIRELEPEFDVDEPEDLEQLRALAGTDAARHCRRSLSALTP